MKIKEILEDLRLQLLEMANGDEGLKKIVQIIKNISEADAINLYLHGYNQALLDVEDCVKDTPVREFHEKFGHPIADKPTIPNAETRFLRVKLVMEEALEFAEASGFEIEMTPPTLWRELPVNILKAADALGDIRYVVDGANLAWGFPIDNVLDEIHASNMSKLDENGKPIYREDGKVLKSSNYREPDIRKILFERWGEPVEAAEFEVDEPYKPTLHNFEYKTHGVEITEEFARAIQDFYEHD